MVQFTAKTNTQGLNKKLKGLEEMIEAKLRDTFENMAFDATQWSPVDTGAYVNSFSFKTNSRSRGRRQTSHGKLKNQDAQSKRGEGFNKLLGDLNGIDLMATKSVTLRNDAQHARAVEDGWPTKPGYGVFRKLRNKYG